MRSFLSFPFSNNVAGSFNSRAFFLNVCAWLRAEAAPSRTGCLRLFRLPSSLPLLFFKDADLMFGGSFVSAFLKFPALSLPQHKKKVILFPSKGQKSPPFPLPDFLKTNVLPCVRLGNPQSFLSWFPSGQQDDFPFSTLSFFSEGCSSKKGSHQVIVRFRERMKEPPLRKGLFKKRPLENVPELF